MVLQDYCYRKPRPGEVLHTNRYGQPRRNDWGFAMSQTRLAAHLYGDLRADRELLNVIDVGCSYAGVGSEWNVFETALRGVGFDPLDSEIQRLRSIEARPDVNYEAAFVGLSASQKIERDAYEATLLPKDRASPNPIGRSSALRAAALQNFDHEKEFFNAGAQVTHAQRHVSLDEYAAETGFRPHVIKIDTDGADMEVLLGAEQVLGKLRYCVPR